MIRRDWSPITSINQPWFRWYKYIYRINYLLHWSYKGVPLAFQNVGALLRNCDCSESPKMSQTILTYFEILRIPLKFWVKQPCLAKFTVVHAGLRPARDIAQEFPSVQPAIRSQVCAGCGLEGCCGCCFCDSQLCHIWHLPVICPKMVCTC